MTRRIVLTCWGSYGDLFPYLAIAVRLKARGHDVVVATCAYYADIVAAHGIAFHPVRPDVNPSDTALLARVMDPARGSEVVVRELVVPHVREAFADLIEIVRTADVVVSHPVTFATPIAARLSGVPWLSSVLAPTSFFSQHDFPVLPPYASIMKVARTGTWPARLLMRLVKRATRAWTAPVREFSASIGVSDRGDPLYEGQFSRRGTLALFSRVIGAPQADWPRETTQTGFVFLDDHQPMPAELSAFLDTGEPPIVFTLGSSAVGAAGSFYVESVEAARLVGRRAVLLAGRAAAAAVDLPANVIAVDYAPHGLLFPRAALVVHHGGVGTTAHALRAGCPMLVVPHAHDQPDNAYRVSKLGVAGVIDAGRYNRGRASGEIRRLLGNPTCAVRAAEARAVILGEDGVGLACSTILAAAGH